MADQEDAASRTEEATPHRLEQARQKGDVAKTPDLSQWASLAAVFGVLLVAGSFFSRQLTSNLTPFIAHAGDLSLQDGGGLLVLRQAMNAGGPILVTVMMLAGLAGAGGHLIQTGFMWSPDKLAPDLSKLNPLTGLKRMFGVDSLMQFLKTLIKVCVVG